MARKRKQFDIDLDLVHGLDAGNYDAAYVGGDWFATLKARIKEGQAVTDEYEGAYIIGFISGSSDSPMNYDEYSEAVSRFGKQLQKLGKHVSYGEDEDEIDENLEYPPHRENPCRCHAAARNPQRPLTVDDRRRERDKARHFWDHLSTTDKWALGDQLVLGSFDWHDWFERRPTDVFLNEVDYLRMLWESSQE